MLMRYRAVLAAPGCARLFATALIGRLPQGMSSLALLLLVRGQTGSYAAAGAAVGAAAFCSAAAAPVLGRLVDRFGRLRVLGPCAVGQGIALTGVVVAAAGGAGTIALIVLSAVSGALLPPIAPAVRALLRDLLNDPQLRESAYALESVIQELIWITGPLLVGGVVAAASPSAAVLACAAVTVVGTLAFLATPATRGGGSRAGGDQRRSALAIPELRALLGPIALTGFGLGAIEVGLPSLALHAGSRPAAGLLLALWSVGSIAGGLWYGSRRWRTPLDVRYRGLLALAVVCAAPLIVARTIPEGIAFSLVSGLTISPVFACQYALIGGAVTPGTETEAFTWVAAALVAGLAAGSAAGGAGIATAGVAAPFVLACAATGLAALAAVRVRGRVGVAA